MNSGLVEGLVDVAMARRVAADDPARASYVDDPRYRCISAATSLRALDAERAASPSQGKDDRP
jgi:hypothetical protein